MEFKINPIADIGICEQCNNTGEVYSVTISLENKSLSKKLCKNCVVKAKQYVDKKNKAESVCQTANNNSGKSGQNNSAMSKEIKKRNKPFIFAWIAAVLVVGVIATAIVSGIKKNKSNDTGNTVTVASSSSAESLEKLYEKYTVFNETGTCGDNATWKMSNDGQLVIVSGTGALWDYCILEDSPDKSGSTTGNGLKYLIIEEGITVLSQRCVYFFRDLEALYLPSTVVKIEESFMTGCPAVKNLVFPNGNNNYFSEGGVLYTADRKELITRIGGIKGTSYTTPDYVETICESAFSDCNKLQKIKIGPNVKAIHRGAFSLAASIKEVYIDDSVESLGNSLFYGCYVLEKVHLPAGITEIPDTTFGCCESLKTFKVPDGVTKIGYMAFWKCYNLETVELPETLQLIRGLAFEDCENLKKINLPSSLQSLGMENEKYTNAGIFSKCSSLKSIVIPQGISINSSYVFKDWNSSQTIYFRDASPSPRWNSEWNGNCDANIVWNYGEKTPETDSETENSISGYKESYRQFLLNYLADGKGNPGSWFSMIYIDGDDTPELIISQGDAHQSNIEIYTYSNSKVEHITDIGFYGWFMYKNRKGVIWVEDDNMSRHIEALFEYKNGEIERIWYAEASDYDLDETMVYTINGESVSEDEYNEERNEHAPQTGFLETPHPEHNSDAYYLTRESILSF